MTDFFSILTAATKVVGAGILAITTSTSGVAPTPPSGPPEFLEKGPGYVVLNPGAAVRIDATTEFYPTGPISPTTIMVVPNRDGTFPEGFTRTDLKAAVTAASGKANGLRVSTSTYRTGSAEVKPAIYGLQYNYSATLNSWGPLVEGRGHFGSANTTKLAYTFSPCCSGQFNQHQGQGWYRGYNGSTLGNYKKLYELGSVRGVTKTTATVPWIPNTAAPGFLRGKCLQTPGCSGSWDSSF